MPPAITDYGNTVVTSATRQAPEFPELLPYTYIGKNFESPEINAERSIRIYVSLWLKRRKYD
jgi:protein TonB